MAVTFRSDIPVRLLQHMGNDDFFCQMARQSTNTEYKSMDNNKLLPSLIRHRHTGPFEHSGMTVQVECPLYVVAQWQRHRTQSYSQMSGRYVEMIPEFWTPEDDIIGAADKKMRPQRTKVSYEVFLNATSDIEVNAHRAWVAYQNMLEDGVAEEVARSVLPQGTYTRFSATTDALNWMRFLSLRTHDPDALVVSYPQREIEVAARQVEQFFAQLWPSTYKAWVDVGRVI